LDIDKLAEQDEFDLIVGFFDLNLYAKWADGRPAREALELAEALFERTGEQISAAGGRLVKAIGDAGLFIFPGEQPDETVAALQQMKRDCDEWLAQRAYPGAMTVAAQYGPVACGFVGPPGDRRFDVYGATVNQAALMQGHEFALGEGLANILSAENRVALRELEDGSFVSAD